MFEMMPEGVIVTRAWLMDKGLSRHAIDNLVKSSQLESLGKGVYVRGTFKIIWESVVYTLQSILKTDLVLGGLTALEMQGLSHYLPLSGKNLIHLYGKDELPSWVNKILSDVMFIRHSEQNLNSRDSLRSFTVARNWKEGVGDLILSSPERAFLEVLLDVPKKISFEHADQLMQGLTTLSPRSLQRLLELCKNVKVRRLFLWFAERQDYAWLNKLNPASIDLGSGNRMLIRDGRLDKKYKITVPVSL